MLRLAEIIEFLKLSLTHEELLALRVGIYMLARESIFKRSPFKASLDRVMAPNRLGMSEFYFDSSLRLAGIVTWARVDSRTDHLADESGIKAITPETWCSGKILWMTDFLVEPSALRGILLDLRDNLLSKESSIKYVRNRRNGWMVKRMQRQGSLSFFRKGPSPGSETSPLHSHALEQRQRSLLEQVEIGNALTIVGGSGQYDSLPTSTILRRLKHCQRIGQLKIVFSTDGIPVGLLTWAWMSARSQQHMSEFGEGSWHPSEWNEGTRLCFFDVAWTGVASKEFINLVERDLFPDEDEVFWQDCTKGESARALKCLSDAGRKFAFPLFHQ